MKKIIPIIFLVISLFALNCYAADFNADEIMKKSINTTEGFIDSYETMKMIIIAKNGDQIERTMTSKVLEVHDDGNKQLIVFQDPPDVTGSAVLTHTHITGNDDQWIYLPALKRVKRISSANKSGPFMGSEFAYEDLSSMEFEKFVYKAIGEQIIDDVRYFKIERRPKYKRSGYNYQIAWIDETNFLIHKIEMYDTADRRFKTQTLTGYKNHFENFWRPEKILMENHQTGRKTILIFDQSVKFNNGFSDRDFKKNAMKR